MRITLKEKLLGQYLNSGNLELLLQLLNMFFTCSLLHLETSYLFHVYRTSVGVLEFLKTCLWNRARVTFVLAFYK